MDYLGHKKLEKNNGIYSSIDGIQEVSGSIPPYSLQKVLNSEEFRTFFCFE